MSRTTGGRRSHLEEEDEDDAWSDGKSDHPPPAQRGNQQHPEHDDQHGAQHPEDLRTHIHTNVYSGPHPGLRPLPQPITAFPRLTDASGSSRARYLAGMNSVFSTKLQEQHVGHNYMSGVRECVCVYVHSPL